MSDEEIRSRRPWWHWVIAAAGTGIFIVLLIWGPWWVEGQNVREDGKLASSAGIIITGLRTALIAIVAGGFTAAGLYYTREKHRLERKQFQHAQEQFAESVKQFETTLSEAQERDERQAELTREDQVTGRYVEAIKLLASEKLHERLGGIYSLERILKDSEKDHDTVVEVLSAFIRTQIQEQQGESTVPVPSEVIPPWVRRPLTQRVEASPWAEDMKAACSVLARSPKRDRPHAADLSGVDMRQLNLGDLTFMRANLERANLRGASLEGVNLDGANLVEADLEEAHLLAANLVGADLAGANLARAHLAEAGLAGARLLGVNLRGARLLGTDLAGANLERANLVDAELLVAHLKEANLREAILVGANLERAMGLSVKQLVAAWVDKSTKLPTEIAADDRIMNRIAECEAERAAIRQVSTRAGEGST
ncbi:pentapeptide repeat-containing protein [Streptomyces sp. NPDC051453]|uniref:pentapeptide repeat-containing protein n=1 Tax=Streptomyces sp. NPDC051453 TaxID=3154941 RepID=UPI003415E30A